MKLVNIGFGNLMASDKILAVVSHESAPVKRIVQDAKEKGCLIDATYGRKTKAVIVTQGDRVVLSALTTEKVAERVNGEALPQYPEEETDGQ